jgi:phosphoglycerate dehydrogenase-like enzyme
MGVKPSSATANNLRNKFSMNLPVRPVILVDPHPRPVELIFDPLTRARLEALGRVIWHDGPPAAAEFLDRHLPEATYLIGQSSLPLGRLQCAPRLRAIFNVEGNFLPNVDYAECQRRGIAVLSTAPVFAQPVAEMALGLALASARRIPETDALLRQGRESLYGAADNADSILLRGRTLGLIGFGNLARALLPLLRPFGGEILAHDPWVEPAQIAAAGVAAAPLEEIFRRSAVVFILSAVTTENRGRLDAGLFARMQPGAIVVLVSRAGVVNFDDLLDAAGAGRIRAAIDVWPEEPIPAGHRARNTPNTLLQAHRAGNVPEIWPEMGRMVAHDISQLEQGLPPQRCQAARWETVAKLRSQPVT